MANFSFTVDTHEMANSIDGVSARVNAATSAVVAMQSAVVAAEIEAANRVCQNVDRGFFALIRSQISQKTARFRSEVDSRFMEMRQQSHAVGVIRSRMERDYQMISERYTKLFRSIDLSLRNRVFELDKAVSVLVSREIERIQIRLRSLQAQVPVHQIDSVQTGQSVAGALTKVNAARAIRAMHSFLSESSRQAHLSESMLFHGASAASDLRYTPVLLVESESLTMSGVQWSVLSAGKDFGRIGKEVDTGVQSAVFATLNELEWTQADSDERARIASEIRILIEQPGIDNRVKTHLLRLFEASQWLGMSRMGN